MGGRPEGTLRCWEHQEACPEVFPDEDRLLLLWAVFLMDGELPYFPALVVPVPNANEGSPLPGVPRVESPAEDHAGRSVEGGREGEEPVQDPGPPFRRQVQPGGIGLPLHYGCGKAGPC